MNRNKLIAKLHILLQQTGAVHHKEELYAGYGVDSCKEMTTDQLIDLIGRLEKTSGALEEAAHLVREFYGESSKVRNKLQSQVLATLNRLGIREDITQKTPTARWAELNQFVRSKNPAGKTIPEMINEELQSLFVVLKSMESKGWRKKEVKPKETPVVIPVSFNPSGPVN